MQLARVAADDDGRGRIGDPRWLQDEPGADEAEPMLMEGVIGAANWSEVLQKARQHGAPAGSSLVC